MSIVKIVLLILVVSFSGYAQKQQSVAFTLEDRDRLIRLEEMVRANMTTNKIRFEAIDKRFEAIDKRFETIDKRFEVSDKKLDKLETFFQTTTFFIFSGVFILIGFILWDRRTFLKPFKQETTQISEHTKALESELNTIKNVLRTLSKNDKKLAELLKLHHLL